MTSFYFMCLYFLNLVNIFFHLCITNHVTFVDFIEPIKLAPKELEHHQKK